MIGWTVETVVSSSMPPGPTRFPICALARPGDAVNGGDDPGEIQIELGLVNGGLGGKHRRAGRLFRADGVVEVFLADGVLIGKWSDPGQVGLGRRPACLLGFELTFRLFQRRLERCAGSISKRTCPVFTKSPSR